MAKVRLMSTSVIRFASSPFALIAACILLSLISCSTMEIKREIQIPKEAKEIKSAESPPPEPLRAPDFVPVQEDTSPLKTRIIDLSARNTPLRDVLYVITEATGLNLVIDKEVNVDIPITISLKNVTAEDGLNKVIFSADYFYTVKNNMLFVKALDTRTFELGYPAIIQSYNTDLGGDILGAATSGGTTTGAAATSPLKGSITQKSETDKSAYNFWDVIEKSIERLLGIPAGKASPTQQHFLVNRLAGTIVVTASRKNLEKIENYINLVKKVINRQVLVEAKIIEVTLSDSLKYGIDWSFLSTYRRTSTTTVGTSGFTSVVPTGGPTFSISTAAADFTSLLNALQTQGETRILSNPRVNIMNGQTAILSVGQNKNFISKVETVTTPGTTGTTTSFTISTSSVLSGIMIGIVPFVSESGEVSMTITPIVSDLVKMETRTFGGNLYQIELPTIDLRELSTTVKMRTGEMVIIGGLIADREELTDNQVPGLGDIPILGYLFKSRSKVVKKSELVVMLQPIIVSR